MRAKHADLLEFSGPETLPGWMVRERQHARESETFLRAEINELRAAVARQTQTIGRQQRELKWWHRAAYVLAFAVISVVWITLASL
jgi:hypothetical protein